MTILIIIVLLGLIGFAGLINSAAAKSVEMLLQPETLLTRIERVEDPDYRSDIETIDAWAVNNGFVHDIYFRFETLNPEMPIYCSAWWSDTHRTWALAYCAPRARNLDFVTKYTERIGVTTASTKDAMMLPSPQGSYRQSFLKLAPSELYRRHLTARALVERHERVSLPAVKEELLPLIEKALLEQAHFITALPFWRWRGALWFLWRRNVLVNKPITIPGETN